MDSIKQIIAANLLELRKMHKMTQQELGQRLNYSDKAISRWEHAETLPDIDTLCKICDIYGVRFEYLLHKEQPKGNPYVVKSNVANRIIIMFIAACTVWISALVTYMYVKAILNVNAWTVFIWAIPITFTVCSVCNRFFFGNRVLKCVLSSLTMWSLLLSVYLQLLEYNAWLLFVIGAPLQAIIILLTVMKFNSQRKEPSPSEDN